MTPSNLLHHVCIVLPSTRNRVGQGQPFQDGDRVIEQGGNTDFTPTVNDGQSLGDLDAGDADRPFLTSAPYSDLNPNDEKTGRVIIQIELDALNLDFLKYDWRGTARDAEEIAAEGESQTMSRFPKAALTIILEPL